jgi:hypothetical protein
VGALSKELGAQGEHWFSWTLQLLTPLLFFGLIAIIYWKEFGGQSVLNPQFPTEPEAAIDLCGGGYYRRLEHLCGASFTSTTVRQCALAVADSPLVARVTARLRGKIPIVHFPSVAALAQAMAAVCAPPYNSTTCSEGSSFQSVYLLGLHASANDTELTVSGDIYTSSAEGVPALPEIDPTDTASAALTSILMCEIFPWANPRLEGMKAVVLQSRVQSGPLLTSKTYWWPFVFPIFFMGAFLSVTAELVSERHCRQQLALSGVPATTYYLSWFLLEGLPQMAAALIGAGLLAAGGAISVSSLWAPLALCFVLHVLSVQCVGALIAAFVRKFAALACIVYALVSFGVAAVLVFVVFPLVPSQLSGQATLIIAIGVCLLLPVVPFQVALYTIALTDDYLQPLSWSRGFVPLWLCVLLLLTSLAAHFLLAMYFAEAPARGACWPCRRGSRRDRVDLARVMRLQLRFRCV